MIGLLRCGLIGLCLFTFQNCGGFEANKSDVPYPYSVQPDFFYDIKLVSVEIDELGREVHEFDVAVSFASDSDQAVSYRVAFSTLNRSGICASQDRIATGDSKHQRFPCLLPTPEDLYIQLTLVGPEGEQMVDQFRF